MHAVYHCNLDELNDEFITNLKKQFTHAKVDIAIREMDETDFEDRQTAKLQALIDEGLASGIGCASMQDLMNQAKAELGYV